MYSSFGKGRIDATNSRKLSEESRKLSLNRAVHNASYAGGSHKANTIRNFTGPLSASTRFNSILDATTYTNVRSPGFTSRLVQCAVNRKSSCDNLEKCSSVGLFASDSFVKHHSSPTHSPSSHKKVVKTPVRIRIAPPSFKESKSDLSKLQIIPSSSESTVVKDLSENKAKNEMDNLQESSRKRIFSECLDNGFEDLHKKRQRRGEILPNPNSAVYHYRHVRAPSVPTCSPSLTCVESLPQGKRARERGSPEEQKRQRRRTCAANNAILSSLSSSRNLLEKLASQKRKSMDSSRPTTPVVSSDRKALKENKVSNKVKGVQCNLLQLCNILDNVPPMSLLEQERSPVAQRTVDTSNKVQPDLKEQSAAISSSEKSKVSDCTTKLFRKELSAPLSRSSSDKERKSTFWAQPPLADELSSSLLNDDHKLDRPERFQSLLACVSGKELKAKNNSGDDVHSAADSAADSTIMIQTSPLNHRPPYSHSAELTVTVSSTSTIMTCASVISVKGGAGPGAAISSPSHISLSNDTLVVPKSPLVYMSNPQILSAMSKASFQPSQAPSPLDTTSTSTTSVLTTKTSSSISPAPSQISLTSESIQNVPSPSVNNFKPAEKTSVASTSSAAVVVQNIHTSSNSLTITGKTLPPTSQTVTTSGAFGCSNNLNNIPSAAFCGNTSAEPNKSSDSSKPSFHFGGSSNEIFKSTFHLGSDGIGILKSSVEGEASVIGRAPLFNSCQSGNSKPAFQFGGGSTSAIKPISSSAGNSGSLPKAVPKSDAVGLFKPTTNTTNSTVQLGGNRTEGHKPTFSFGSTLTETPKQTFQFGSNSKEVPKEIPSFGSSSEASRSFQFSANVTNSSKQTPLFGSGSAEAQALNFQFGALASNSLISSNVPKSASQFVASSTEASRPTFQFGAKSSTNSSNTNNVMPQIEQRDAAASRPAFQFLASSGGASNLTGTNNESTQQFGSGSIVGPRPMFQFGNKSNEDSKSHSPFVTNPKEPPTPTYSFASNSSDASRPPLSFEANSTVQPAFQFGSSSKQGFQFNTSSGQKSCPVNSETSALSGSRGFSFGSSTQSSFSGTSGNSSHGAFSLGSSTSSNSSFGAPSFGVTVVPSSSFSSTSTSVLGTTPAANAGSTVPAFGTPSTNSNAFKFGTENSTFSGPSFQFAKTSLGTAPQPPNTVNGSSGLMFSQMTGNAMQLGATPASSSACNQNTQSSGLFSIGSSSAPTRRIREARRRR